MIFTTLKEKEYSDIADGVKSLLKESYPISEDEAVNIVRKGRERAEGLLADYIPFAASIQEACGGIKSTLDTHLKQVDEEEKADSKMVREAAVWHAFERVKRFYMNKANHL